MSEPLQPLVKRRKPDQTFPGHARHRHPAQGWRGASGGWDFVSTSTTAKPWAWLAKAAAEKPPPGAPSWACTRPPPEWLPSTVRMSAHARGSGTDGYPPQSADDLPGPYASLNPRWTVNSIVSEPLRVHH